MYSNTDDLSIPSLLYVFRGRRDKEPTNIIYTVYGMNHESMHLLQSSFIDFLQCNLHLGITYLHKAYFLPE